ncbi:MAG: NAD(P)/FAD-dependent oxidoreductase [Microcystaceae cyanobacterium]
MNTDQRFDVAIIGAGLAGLTCASVLQQQGYKVVILEKSRGVGGRLATRRVEQTCVDHGLSYFFKQGNFTQQLIKQLTENKVINSFRPKRYQFNQTLAAIPSQPYYYAPKGMTAIAKDLADALTIWRQYRVMNLIPNQDNLWYITCETPPNQPNTLLAKSLVSAIPAPQLYLLLNSSHLTQLSSSFLETLNQVTYDPCLTVMAGYDNLNLSDLMWEQVQILSDSNIAWIGLESVKRDTQNQSVFVLHSTPNYAEKFLDSSDLKPIGKSLLNEAEKHLPLSLKDLAWYQVHRWRYAIPRHFLPISCLETNHPLPLVACGDWCAGKIKTHSSWHLEKAIASGLAAAKAINDRSLSTK